MRFGQSFSRRREIKRLDAGYAPVPIEPTPQTSHQASLGWLMMANDLLDDLLRGN
jgi:hypothetical protein